MKLAIVERWRTRRRIKALLREAAEEDRLARYWHRRAVVPGLMIRDGTEQGLLQGLLGVAIEAGDRLMRVHGHESPMEEESRVHAERADGLRAEAWALAARIKRGRDPYVPS